MNEIGRLFSPEPLPPVRKIEIVCTETITESQCSVCCVKKGTLTCRFCKAVLYCGASCERKQWPTHQYLCEEIKTKVEETKAFTEPLKLYKLPDNTVVNIFQ
jgi:hypothetical protein